MIKAYSFEAVTLETEINPSVLKLTLSGYMARTIWISIALDGITYFQIRPYCWVFFVFPK
jgi:hypothetical protein